MLKHDFPVLRFHWSDWFSSAPPAQQSHLYCSHRCKTRRDEVVWGFSAPITGLWAVDVASSEALHYGQQWMICQLGTEQCPAMDRLCSPLVCSGWGGCLDWQMLSTTTLHLWCACCRAYYEVVILETLFSGQKLDIRISWARVHIHRHKTVSKLVRLASMNRSVPTEPALERW